MHHHLPVLCTTALELSFSAAEYACPVWERSAHACHLDPVLNESCRLITGCLKPTNTSNLHLLAGIASPEIRREAASKQERLRQVCDPRHMLFNYKPAPPRLKSRKSFLHSVDPPEGKIKTWREEAWERKLEELPSSNHYIYQISNLMKLCLLNHNWSGKCGACLNRFRSGVTRTKTELKKWGFADPSTSVICRCGEENESNDTIQHRFTCSLLNEPCSIADLCDFNESQTVRGTGANILTPEESATYMRLSYQHKLVFQPLISIRFICSFEFNFQKLNIQPKISKLTD